MYDFLPDISVASLFPYVGKLFLATAASIVAADCFVSFLGRKYDRLENPKFELPRQSRENVTGIDSAVNRRVA